MEISKRAKLRLFSVPLFFVPGLPFGLFKVHIYQIWLFLKLFATHIMDWPFGNFWPFFNVDKNCIFLRPGANAIKKFNPSLGIPYLGV